MYLADVNIYIYAHREEFPEHSRAGRWLINQAESVSKFAVSELVLSVFLRIVTNSKIFKPATTVNQSLSFVDNIIQLPNVQLIHPGQEHWGIFSDLVSKYQLTGKLVADAYHASLAIEHGCTWVTYDSDYARFGDELRYELL